MLCPEYSRLLQHYEVALRRWAQVANRNERLSAGIWKKALDEHDAAKERLNLHERTCPTCIHNHQNPPSVK
jgi:hypothetical protein